MNEWIKITRSAVSQTAQSAVSVFAAPAAKLRKRDISIASEHFQVFGAIFLVAELPSRRSALVHKN